MGLSEIRSVCKIIQVVAWAETDVPWGGEEKGEDVAVVGGENSMGAEGGGWECGGR